MGRGSHSHRSVSRPGRRWPGICSRACRTGWRRLAAGEEASSAIAGPGRCEAVPCCAGWHKQQAPISRQGGECHELSRPGQAPRPARGVDPTAKLEYDDIRARAISRADTTTMCRASMPASSLSGGPAAAAGRPSRSASTSTTSMRSGTNASSREGGSFTYAVYDSRGQYPDAATCTRWDGAPSDRRAAHVRRRCELVGHARRRTGAATRAGPPGPRARSGRASSLRPRIDIAATVYPTSGRRRDGGVESSAGLSASTSSSMKITS